MGSKKQGVEALRFLVVNWEVVAVDGDNEVKAEARYLGIPCISQEDMCSYIRGSDYARIHYGKDYVGLDKVDLLISYLYKQKVVEPLLSYPRLGCVNFHPGWLPDFGGACGYNIAILEKALQYGCTAHFMTDQIDRGDIIARRAVYLYGGETAYSLAMKTYEEMFELLQFVWRSFENGTVKRIPQKNTRYMKWAEVDKLRTILPEDDTETIDRKIRAFYFPPYNGAEIELKGKKYTLAYRGDNV